MAFSISSWANDNVPFVIRGEAKIDFPATHQRQGFGIEIRNNADENAGFPEDYFHLQLYAIDHNGRRAKDLTEMAFTSSYGDFELRLADATHDGIEDIILIRGEGRGTSAREEHLEIYKWNNKRLKKIFKIQISGYYGSGLHWHYAISNLNNPNLRVQLLFKFDGITPDAQLELLPEIRSAEIIYDPKSGKMIMKKIKRQTGLTKASTPTRNNACLLLEKVVARAGDARRCYTKK